MIIIPSKKFIYLGVPKTGSTSVSQYLNDKFINIKDLICAPVGHTNFKRPGMIDNLGLIHASIKDIIEENIININSIDDYKIFATIRNPVDRFISHSYFSKHTARKDLGDDINNIVCYFLEKLEKDLENVKKGNPRYSITSYPQIRWLIYNNQPISNIYSYEHLDRLTKEALVYTGVGSGDTNTYRYRMDTTRNRTVSLDSELQNQIIKYYYDDYVMYNEIRSKEKDMD